MPFNKSLSGLWTTIMKKSTWYKKATPISERGFFQISAFDPFFAIRIPFGFIKLQLLTKFWSKIVFYSDKIIGNFPHFKHLFLSFANFLVPFFSLSNVFTLIPLFSKFAFIPSIFYVPQNLKPQLIRI